MSPYEILADFRQRYGGVRRGFMMSRLILAARIIPEEITPELEDDELAARMLDAIDEIEGRVPNTFT